MRRNWHTADIIAAVHKQGTSLAALSREVGLSSSTLANALYRQWPKGEALIADKIGVHPSEIWPDRYYNSDGKLIDRKSRARVGISKMVSTTILHD